MKLGFLIYSYFPYGGQQRDFHRIVQECISRGHDVRIYTLKWQGEQLENATIRFVNVKAMRRPRLYQRFTEWTLNDLKEHPCDVVIGFNKMPGLDIYFAADPCFAEKVEFQRGAYYRYTSRYRHFSNYEQQVFGQDSDTRVLFLSQLQKDAFVKYYPGCGDRLYLIPPGIDSDRQITDAAPKIRKQFRNEFNLGDDDLLILQIGSGFRVKGVDRSLHAIASLPQDLKTRVKFLLVGQGKPRPYLKIARKLGIENQVTVLPGQDDIPRFLLGADILLHPAYREAAGYVLLEATIAGLPVLTNESCGYADHIKRAGSGLVCSEPFQQEELNAKLETILSSPERELWKERGIAYGKQEDLYSQAIKASDLIEQFGKETISG